VNAQSSPDAVSAHNRTVVDQWLDSRPFSAETRRSYRRELYWIGDQIGNPIETIDASGMAAITELLVDRPRRSAHRIISTLRSFLIDMRSAGTVREISAALPLPATEDADRDVDGDAGRLTESKVIQLIAMTTKRRDHALLRVLYEIPLLPSELVTVSWADLHLIEGKPSLMLVRAGEPQLRRMRIPLWSQLIRIRVGAADADPMFDLSERQIRSIVRAAGDRIGLSGVTPRELRDAHIVHASRKGASDAAVRNALGGTAIGERRARAAAAAAAGRGAEPTSVFIPHF
jgi:site-specific recombinase XerC